MSQHQFVHIGDAHFGPQGGRNAVRWRALDQIVTHGSALPSLAAWLWPGDLNHARMTIEDRNALAERLVTMAHRAPVVIVYGNHDLPGDLDVFGRLQAAYPVYVVDRPAVLSVRLATGAMAAIAALPYPSRAGLVAAGAAPGQTLEAGRAALATIVEGLAAGLALAYGRGEIALTIGHVNVGGALASTGQPQIGQEIELDPGLVAKLSQYGYVGLNHIHRPQVIHGAYYAGSIAPSDWGETEPKRFLVVTYDRHSDPTYAVASCPLDVPPLYHVEGDLSPAGFTWRVTAGPGGAESRPPADWAGAEVRVRFRFRASERDRVDEGAVRRPFARAARLTLEPVAVPDRALRAPAVAEARTLADKVRAWAEVSGVVLADGVLQKLARLEHEDAPTLLSALRTDLARLEAPDAEAVSR